MIARLTGRIAETTVDALVVDVNGVGYLVYASARTIAAAGAVGDPVQLFTDMQVSENDMRLMGFATRDERDCFRLLNGVQGVGAKVALAILSTLDPGDLHRAIAGQDKAMVARANGVGPKLAERIVRELKDKVGAFAGVVGTSTAVPMTADGAAHDALSALANLGFKPHEASAAVAAALEELGDGATLDALVRAALKRAAR